MPSSAPAQPAAGEVGDPVCALLAGGGYAEYCVAPEGQCMAVPAGTSLRDAAAIPEAAITVWANLFEPRRLFAGNFFLVQGGSSGIGTLAIQIARAFGARVATTAGTDEKCSFCRSLGAEIAINYRTRDWAAELARWSQPHGIDCILDMIGGDYFAKHVSLLATGGRSGAHCLLPRQPGDDRFTHHDDQAAADHRVDASPAHGGREVFAGPSRGAGALATVHKRTAAACRRSGFSLRERQPMRTG